MEFEDRSDQPRSNVELKEALVQVETSIVRDMLKIPPSLAVHLTTIREGLMELIKIREVM